MYSNNKQVERLNSSTNITCKVTYILQNYAHCIVNCLQKKTTPTQTTNHPHPTK